MRNEDTAEKLAYPNIGEASRELKRAKKVEVSDDSSLKRNLDRL